jgi:hypothetical protein
VKGQGEDKVEVGRQAGQVLGEKGGMRGAG